MKEICIGIGERYEIHFVEIETDEDHVRAVAGLPDRAAGVGEGPRLKPTAPGKGIPADKSHPNMPPEIATDIPPDDKADGKEV